MLRRAAKVDLKAIRGYELTVDETTGGGGKRILKKDLPKFIRNARRAGIAIVGLPGIESGPLLPYQNFYIVTGKRR
jgi:hypothetical protein